METLDQVVESDIETPLLTYIAYMNESVSVRHLTPKKRDGKM